jgi:putative hydrolase of the HAD superfamily
MTRALIFDLGNVIVAFDYNRGYRAIEPFTPFPASEISGRIGATGLVLPFERGEVSGREFYERMAAALQISLTFERFCELWSAIFLPDPLLPDGLLESLHRRYRLVLLSNTNEIHFEMIRRTYPILRHFDALVVSHEVGALKPDERMYAEAVRRAACEPAQCFYTDDVPAFVEGGRRFGLDAVQFTGASDLQRHLRDRGLID